MHHNGLRTGALLAGSSALIVAAGGAAGGVRGLLPALALAVAVNAGAYLFGDRVALTAMRARPVGEVECPGLYRIVRELSRSAHHPMPRLYLAPTAQPNAFATGRTPRRAAVCCTTGLLEVLDERELRGVLGHELSHVYNRDILISSIAGALAAAVTYLAQLAWLLPIGGDDDDGEGLFGTLLLVVLGPVAALVIRASISRTREYQADTAGALLTGDPLALADALRKIDAGTRALPLAADRRLVTAGHLLIANPFTGRGLVRLFASHPPTADRIRRLEALAGRR